jgi:hypothetical protein
MVFSMAGFALEDAFIKTVTKQLPVGQVLMLFGLGGAMVFAVLARRRGVALFNTCWKRISILGGSFSSFKFL